MSRDNEADVTDVDGDETVAADVEHTSGEADDTTAEETLVSSHAVANDGPSGTRGLLRGLLVPLLLGALLLVSAGATTWIYFAQYRSDQAVGDVVKARVMQCRVGRNRFAAVVFTGHPGQGLRERQDASDR